MVSRRVLLQRLTAAVALSAASPALAACLAGDTSAAPSRAAAVGGAKVGLLVPSAPMPDGDWAALGAGLRLSLALVRDPAGAPAVEWVVAAAAADAAGEVRAARELLARDDLALLAGATSADAVTGVLAAVHEARVPCLLADTGGRDPRPEPRNPYAFFTAPSNWQISRPLGEWLYHNLAERVYVSASDSPWGRESAAAFKRGFAHPGVAVVAESYVAPGTVDFAPELARLARARADCVYACYAGAEAVAFARQLAAAGLGRTVRLAGPGALMAEVLLPEAGVTALGAITSLDWTLTRETPENARFRRAYHDHYGGEPDVLAARGYDLGRVLVEALRRAGADAGSRGRLLDAIAGVRFEGPRGPFRFDGETRRAVLDVYVRDVKDQRGTLTNVVLETVHGVRDPGRLLAEG